MMVVFQSDKSGKLTADTVENYNDALRKHTENDNEINENRVKEVEREMNQQLRQFNKMFSVGKALNQEERIAGASTSTNVPPPPQYALRKDHKSVEPGQEEVGPKTRGVCGASEAPNSKFSHLLSMMINQYVDCENDENECESSEEMKAAIEEFNKLDENIRMRCVVLSMDVKALYPSMKWSKIIKAVMELIENSKMKIENVNWREISKYIAVMFTPEEIEGEGLTLVIPNRESKRAVTINYLQSSKNDEKWSKARKPGVRQEKKMLAMVISKGVELVMSNHTYKVGDNIFIQSEGGPIGLELTGAVSRAYMLKWDREYLNAVLIAGIKMRLYKRYIDDSNQIPEEVPAGYKYDGDSKKLIFDETWLTEWKKSLTVEWLGS